jgi:hypothetical protein
MKMNIRILLLLTVIICIYCTGYAYALPMATAPTFDPEPPFWPGEHVKVSTTIGPYSGVNVILRTELGPFASGYTDTNGKFTANYIIPDDAFDWVQNKVFNTGYLCFQTTLPDYYSSSMDIYCQIVPKTDVPEFPSVVVPIAAILGLVTIFGRKRIN